MPCLIAFFALFSPRLALFVMLIFEGHVFPESMGGWLVPIIGFFLLPWTTLAYALLWLVGNGEVSGFAWFIVILAFLIDIASVAGGMAARARRS